MTTPRKRQNQKYLATPRDSPPPATILPSPATVPARMFQHTNAQPNDINHQHSATLHQSRTRLKLSGSVSCRGVEW